jgi:preprotein translocase subunit SecB
MKNNTANTKDKITVTRQYTKDKSFELCLIAIIKSIAQNS